MEITLTFEESKKSSPVLRGVSWEESLPRDLSRHETIGWWGRKKALGVGILFKGGFPAQSAAVWKM
jgi:hypothetical protein